MTTIIFHNIERHKAIYAAAFISFMLVLGGWGWAYSSLRDVNGPLIIHFNNHAGINQIGSLKEVGGIGMLGISILIVNFAIALALDYRDRFWGKFVAASTVFMAILLFIGFASIIGVN